MAVNPPASGTPVPRNPYTAGAARMQPWARTCLPVPGDPSIRSPVWWNPLLPKGDFHDFFPVVHNPDKRGIRRGSRHQNPAGTSLDPHLSRGWRSPWLSQKGLSS